MAWTTDMVTMVRILINDTESPQTYTDVRLQSIIAVAARYVEQEISFDVDYTINATAPSISPDPTLAASLDDAFTNFVVLKAACLTDISTLRTKAVLAGLEARCGPAILKTLKNLDGFKELLDKGPCAAYDKLKNEYTFGERALVHFILSPFIGNNFDPESLNSLGSGGFR